MSLPQRSVDKISRDLKLEKERSDRKPLIINEFPTRHAMLPYSEQDIYLKVSRSIQLDYFRLWLNWAGTNIYNRWKGISNVYERHKSALWLFPDPCDKESMKFPLSDSYFAKQRFCGPQTSFLTRVNKMPDWVHNSEQLNAKFQRGSLYVVNYSILVGFQTKIDCYLPKVIGLFSYEDNIYETEAFSIDDIFVGKESSGLWEYAKSCFQICDSLCFYVFNRACSCFLFLEPIVLYFYGSISSEHPLYSLLEPMFKGHANSCKWINKLLLKDGGSLCDLLPLTGGGIRDMVKFAYKSWSFEKASFDVKIKIRGLHETKGYSYAEDGKDIYEAIESSMSICIDKIYTCDIDIKEDTELQSWINQVSDETKGRVKGFPNNLETKTSLVKLLSRIFYQFVFEKAIVNMTQYDTMSFMPTFPTWIKKIDWEHKPLTSEDVIRLLDNEKRTSFQLHATFVSCHELVEFPIWKKDEIHSSVLESLEIFHSKTKIIKEKMRERASQRPTPFKYFVLHEKFLV